MFKYHSLTSRKITMPIHDEMDFEEFKEVLHLFRKTLQLDLLENADQLLSVARETIENLNQHQSLIQLLTANPLEVKTITADLLENFHAVAERAQSQLPHTADEETKRKAEIGLVWRLWPVLHRLLTLQSNIDFDHDDYNKKASELYGGIAQLMESPVAVQVLKTNFDQILPLPGA